MSQALPLNAIYSFYSILIRAGRIPCLVRLTTCPHFARLLEAPVVEEDLAGLDKWKDKDFLRQSGKIDKYKCNIGSKQGDLDELRAFLSQKRTFLLRLLENPNLLEHESFTALLWAVFHLTEELECRNGFKDLPDTEYNHLSGDIKRAYLLIIKEYLAYIKHLKTNYPYLFSLAARTNPFNDEASPIVNN